MSKAIEITRLIIEVDGASQSKVEQLIFGVGMSARVEQTSVEVCEACEAEITKDNPERECSNRCGDAMCYSCELPTEGEILYIKPAYICPSCAEDGSDDYPITN